MNSTPEEKLLDLIRKGHSKARAGKELRKFTKINIVLIAVIILTAFIFLADVFVFKKYSPESPALDMEVEETRVQPVVSETAEEEMPDISAINKGISISKVSRERILANLNLLGIITGENNQAIIEDKTLKKTYFLYKGDSFGDLKVYDIKDNGVILDYNGERIELKM